MEFKDRVANKPNRVKLTYEDSGVSSFATVELADEPIEEGTPLNALNMNNLLNKENDDYIVEQGKSEVWFYRKWASGIAECWGIVHSTATAAWDSLSCACTINLPFYFESPPVVNCSGGQVGYAKSYVQYTNSTTREISSYIKCSIEPDPIHYCFFMLDVKGFWK